MRILHVSECLPGGPASYFNEMLPYQLDVLGSENVGVLVPTAQSELVSASAISRVFTYHQDARGVLSFLRLVVALRRVVLSFRPDVVHLHSTVAGAAGRLLRLVTRSRFRVVFCAHGWMIDPDRPTRFRGILTQVEKVLSRVTDCIINISPHEEKFLLNCGFDSKRMTLITSGIRPSPPPLERPLEQPGGINLLFIGRLDYQKGFDLLLDAVERLTVSNVTLTIVGEAVRAPGRTDKGVNANIQFTGWLARDEVAKQLAETDAVVMPSRWEGMPLVALEAMRAGKAIIASDRGAFPFIVKRGVTGVLVDSYDPNFLEAVLAEHGKRDFIRMGKAAREFYEERFQSFRMNEAILALYRKLCSGSRPKF